MNDAFYLFRGGTCYEGDPRVPTHLHPAPAYTGRYLGKRMDRVRRGGGGVGWSGDACVALARGCRCSWEQDEGDASVPTPHHPNPRPYGYERASEVTSQKTYL